MSEKFLAGLVAAVVIPPLCALCALGPAVIASSVTGIAAWLGGIDGIVVAGLVLVAGIADYGFVRKRGARHTATQPKGQVSR